MPSRDGGDGLTTVEGSLGGGLTVLLSTLLTLTVLERFDLDWLSADFYKPIPRLASYKPNGV